MFIVDYVLLLSGEVSNILDLLEEVLSLHGSLVELLLDLLSLVIALL